MALFSENDLSILAQLHRALCNSGARWQDML